MLSFFLSLTESTKKKDVIQEMDGHRFRAAVFNRDTYEMWVAILTSQDFEGHTEAYTEFEKAFEIGKGYLKFAYLDAKKNPHIHRRLDLKVLPQYCIFYPGGNKCIPANISARELINLATFYVPDFSVKIDEKNLDDDLTATTAILFTEKKNTPLLWTAISYTFNKFPIRIGKSNDAEFAKKLGVDTLPAIVIHNFTKNIVYEGALEFIPLRDTIKKFMQKKLQKISKPKLFRSVSELDSTCTMSDTYCVIYNDENVSPEIHALRKKYTSEMLMFYYGTKDLPISIPPNGVGILTSDKYQFVVYQNADEFEKQIPALLAKTAELKPLEL